MSALSFDQVTCLRGGRLLFEELSFALAGGEALLLTGPNGAGKSSLIRLAAGLLLPAAGAVRVEGRCGLIDERHALDLDLPLVRALRQWGGNVASALEQVGLARLAAVPVRMLSSGQRKRAALARMLLAEADIWLLDEPSNGLDADGVVMLEAMLAAHRSAGGMVLVASHLSLALPGARALRLPL